MHQSAFWVLGHFARFIQPGARRVLTDASERIDTTAFANPDGTVAVVASNPHDEALRLALGIDGEWTAADLPPRSIATFVTEAA